MVFSKVPILGIVSKSIACIHDLGLDLEKVNVNGGAIVLEYPVGCSGIQISAMKIINEQIFAAKYQYINCVKPHVGAICKTIF